MAFTDCFHAVGEDEAAFGFGPLFWNLDPFADHAQTIVGDSGATGEAWAREIVEEALARQGFVNPSLATKQIAQAIMRLEGGYGHGWRGNGLVFGGDGPDKASIVAAAAASHNWGAVQCCKPTGGNTTSPPDAPTGPCPSGSFLYQDTNPNKTPTHYWICFRAYPDDVTGAADAIRIATKTDAEKAAWQAGDVRAVSTAMYDAKYYQSPYKQRDAAINFHVAAVLKNAASIAKALGEPLAIADGSGAVAQPPAGPPQGVTPSQGGGDDPILGLLAALGVGAFFFAKSAMGHVHAGVLDVRDAFTEEALKTIRQHETRQGFLNLAREPDGSYGLHETGRLVQGPDGSWLHDWESAAFNARVVNRAGDLGDVFATPAQRHAKEEGDITDRDMRLLNNDFDAAVKAKKVAMAPKSSLGYRWSMFYSEWLAYWASVFGSDGSGVNSLNADQVTATCEQYRDKANAFRSELSKAGQDVTPPSVVDPPKPPDVLPSLPDVASVGAGVVTVGAILALILLVKK